MLLGRNCLNRRGKPTFNCYKGKDMLLSVEGEELSGTRTCQPLVFLVLDMQTEKAPISFRNEEQLS